MPVRRTPRRRRPGTILTDPETVTVVVTERLNPDGTRRIGPDEHAALVEILDLVPTRPPTFLEYAAHHEALAQHIITRAGGTKCTSMPDDAALGTLKAGYLIPGHVETGSQLDYALTILWLLHMAQSPNLDEARRFAFRAGATIREAEIRSMWEPDALLGEKIRAKNTRSAQRPRGSGDGEPARERQRFRDAVHTARARYPQETPARLAGRLFHEWGGDGDPARARAALAKRIRRVGKYRDS